MSAAEQFIPVDEEFLVRLYAGVPDDVDAYAAIMGPSTKFAARTWRPVTDITALARDARKERVNAYVNVHPAVRGLRAGRNAASTTAVVVGWVADLDFAVPGHATKNLRLPADWTEAKTILTAAKIPEPSMVIMSGGGAQCYWLAREAWVITDDDNRAEIISQSRRFTDHLKATGAALKMHVDNVSDIARILRVPGSVREKDGCQPITVELLTSHGPSYGWDELAAWAPPTPPREPRHRTNDPVPEHLEQGIRLILETYRQRLDDIESMPDGSGRHNKVRDNACWIGSHLHYLHEAGTMDPAQELYSAAVACGLVDHEGQKTVSKTIDSGIEIGQGTPYYLPPLRLKKGTTSQTRGPKRTTQATRPADSTGGDGPDITDNGGGDDDYGARPEVITNNRELGVVRDEALEAIHNANRADPSLFLRGGVIVSVTADENGRALIIPINKAAMRNYATDSATFMTRTERTKDGETYVIDNLVSPPQDVVESILALPVARLPFPALVALTEAPIIRPDGSIRTDPGYDEATRFYYLPSERLDLPEIPDTPTPEQLRRAYETVNDLLVDFPFVDQSSRANAFGMIVGAVVRSAVTGSAPLAVVDATAPGTGKSLLTDMAAVIATGRPASFISWPGDEDEARKMLTSAFAAGSTFMPLDNIEGALRSKNLASALTSKEWSDRLLGQSHKLNLLVRCSWVANGNGVTLKGDLPRRAFWIRMEARTNRPWTRTGFRHPNLIEHVRENRAEILGAILTMARAWYAAGKPEPKVRPIGSFEEWTRMVGGILELAGVDHFLGNAEELYETNNHDEEEWLRFLTALKGEFTGGEFTAGEVANVLETQPVTWRDLIPGEITTHVGRNTISKAIGEAFNSRAGRRWDEDGMRLAKVQSYTKDGTAKDKKNRMGSQIWTIAYDVKVDDL